MNTHKYGVYEKQVKAVLGEGYLLERFVEGVDYVRYKIRVGTRVMFRNGILEELGSVVVAVGPADVPERSEQQVDDVPQEKPVVVVDGTRDAVVTQRYPNPRYVNTTIGRVFVGGKPVKLGQKIRVRNSELVIDAVSYLG